MGETDISGLGLLEAHLRLDWAADGLGLTSSSIGSAYPYKQTHSSPSPPACTQLLPTELPMLPYIDLIAVLQPLHKTYLLKAPHASTHGFFTSAPGPMPGSQPLPFHYAHIFPPCIFEGPLWEGPGPNFQWLGTKVSKT